MKTRNKLNQNKFQMKSDEMNNINIKNQKIIKSENINKKISQNNNIKNRSKSNSRPYNNRVNTASPKNRSHNISKNIFNQKISEIIKYTEEELGSLDSEKHIQNVVKILENFQKELIEQLEQEYDENSIKKVLQTNFDKIIKLLIQYFTLYDNNCSNCIINLKQMLNNILNTNNIKLFENNNIEDISINRINSSNNNISFFDEEKKKEFLNGEEIIVGLINSLSGGIKTCNKNYRTTIFNMAKLIEESNSGLIELKNKFDTLSNQLKTNYIKDIQYKKNINLFLDNISNDIENLYSMNISIIEDVKLLDTYQTSFYDDAKKIFNQLKINHSKKLKEFHLLFQSISSMQSLANSSQQIIKKRGKSISGTKNEKKNFLDEENYEEKSDGENKMNRNNSTKNFNVKNNYGSNKNNISENLMFNDNNNNINIFVLAGEVLEFFNKMKNLQECIVKKVPGTNQMKLDFERYKKKLIKLLNNIINNKNQINSIQNNSNTKLINSNDNDTIIINNKNNINVNSYQNIKTMFQINNKIIKVEQFQIINNIKKKILDNKNDEISDELQTKYNNLLEEVNNKSQELNKLQDKINKLLLENKELNSKNKKLDKDNQTLLSKMSSINTNPNININSEKKIKQNNFTEFEKVNIDDIISSSNNINNNSINSNHELFKLTDNELKLKQENKNLKDLMNKCVQIIFESIKETSPNMIEDNLINDESDDKIKINKNNQNENEEEDEFDMEYINEAVKKFQDFNAEIAKNLKKAEEEKEKFEKEAHENLVKAEAYKNALDQAINKINIGDDNNSDTGEKIHNKRQFTFDGEGEISFKGNIGNTINNKYSKNIKEEKKVDNNENNNNGINEEINKLLIESNNEENNINNDNNNENKNNNINENNEDVNKVNKDLLKVQQSLIEKIKSLEEEIEKNKTTIHNLFIESGNDLYDINEMTVSMTKYNRLLKLLETEQERNKNLEEKYISFINEITENLSLNTFNTNINTNISDKKANKKENNKITDDNIEFEDHSNKNKMSNKKMNKNRTYGELNVHSDNYLSLLNKEININGDEEENDDENDDIKMNKANSGLYKSLRMQELVEENKDLKEKETLLSTQLVTIKQELKETRYFLDEMKNKNIELAQEIESQGTLRNQNLIGSLRNCLERLITEIKINNKIKEILIVLLRLASYTDEQIEIIFKYKEKKKNIINIFQME